MGHSGVINARFQRSYRQLPEWYVLFSMAQDRSGAVRSALLKFQSFFGVDVLDLGCANAAITRSLICESRHFVAVDCSVPLLRRLPAHQKLAAVAGRAQALPFREAVFDVILSLWGDYAIPRVWKELRRVLRPEGAIYAIFNRYDEDFARLWPTVMDHVWELRRLELEALGFKSQKLDIKIEFESVDEARKVLGFFFPSAKVMTSSLKEGLWLCSWKGEGVRSGSRPGG